MDDLPLPTARFDQQPINNTNKFNMSEYPEGYDPSNPEPPKPAEPLPLAKRLNSKVFKVKKQAMEELLKIVTNENHKQFQQHQLKIIQSISDSNPQCQILAAKILLQFLEKQGAYDQVVKEDPKKSFPKQVIQKLLIIEREQAQNVGMNILFWLMDHSHDQLLLNQLNDYLLNKNPKIVAVTFKILQTLVNNYGPKKLGDLEIFYKNLKLLSEPPKPVAKNQTVQFFQELFKWKGDNIFSEFKINNDCKDEIIKWSKTYERQPMEIKRGLKKGEAAKKVMPNEEDDEQDSTPMDVLINYDSRWVDNILALEKWQEKKDQLDEFIKKTNFKVIVPRETSHFITLLKRLFQDNNINLLQCGYKIVKNLCRGLKKGFSLVSKNILPYIYLRLKDNKQAIVDETLATLKVMTASITIEDLEKEVVEALKDKSPQMRLSTLKLLKEVCTKKQQKTSKILKSMLNTLVSLTNDSSSDVRDAALSVLCKIKEQHGMMFFEAKLESLPAKKLNAIKSTPTAGIEQSQMNPEITENSNSNSLQRTNNNTNSVAVKSNAPNPKENKSMTTQNKGIQPNKKKSIGQQNQQNLEPQMGISKNQPNQQNQFKQPQKPQPQLQKPAFTMQTKEMNHERQMVTHQLQNTREEPLYNNSINQQEAEQQQMIEIRNQQWGIVPTKDQVLQLINLFRKMGEPFETIATPLRLKIKDIDGLQNCDSSFMIDNADILLKWALWKIQTEREDVVEKITCVVVHLAFLMKTKMNDSLTFSILCIISSLIDSDFNNFEMLQCLNISIMQSSENLREQVFNFWLKMLNDSDQTPAYCDRTVFLLKSIYSNIEINNDEIVAMARVEAIVKSKMFMDFLATKRTPQFLKVSGFKIVEAKKPENQFLLRMSDPDFIIDIRLEERTYFFDIFKKMSHEATEDIINIEKNCPKQALIDVHIKIMDSVLLQFLDQNLQSINMHNYMHRLAGTITGINESFINPHLKNLLRLLMFFLVDISHSRLQDKNQLIKTTNKILLSLLGKVSSDHLLECLGMLLRYSYQKNFPIFSKKLNQLFTKCMNRALNSQSFQKKVHKNVKMMFNFIISFIEEFRVSDEDPTMKAFVEMFTIMMNLYKELCYENVIEKLQYFRTHYDGNFISQVITDMFNRFMNRPEQEEKNQHMHESMNPEIINQGASRNERVMENNQFMSNLPDYFQSRQNEHGQNPQGMGIREATNIPRKELEGKGMGSFELLGNEGARIKDDRRRLQDFTSLCQSYDELTKIQNQLNASTIGHNVERSKDNNNQSSM